MQVAIYSRVSTDDQAEGHAIKDQITACERYAAAQGWTVTRHYSDPGISGSLAEQDRPGLGSLLGDAPARLWSALLVWDESRLARNVHLAGHLYHLLDRAGVRVISVSHPETSRLEGGIRRILAEEQRETTREAVRRAMQAIIREGGYRGGRRIYGYRVIGEGRGAILEPDPVEAAALRALFSAAAEGEPIIALARAADRCHAVILRRLRHPAYAGGYRAPEGIRWGHHAPIVDRETWDAVQARLDRQAGSDHLPRRIGVAPLSGLLTCPDCGRTMQMDGRKRQGSGLVWWYVCHTHGHRRRIAEGWIPGTLWPTVMAWARDPSIHKRIADMVNAAYRQGVSDGSLAAEVRALEGRASRLTEAIASGLIPDVRSLASQLGDAQGALDAARARLAASRRVSRVLLTPAAVAAALSARIVAGSEPTRETLHSALDTIIVAGDRYAVYPATPEPRSYLWAPPMVRSRMDVWAVPVAA